MRDPDESEGGSRHVGLLDLDALQAGEGFLGSKLTGAGRRREVGVGLEWRDTWPCRPRVVGEVAQRDDEVVVEAS